MIEYEEHGRIPFESWSPVARNALVIAPHPDDEVIGCGGLIAHLISAGASVHVAIVTDGAAGGEGDLSELAALRQRESTAGLAVLGAPAPTFLGYADRSISRSLPELATRFGELVAQLQPDLIVLPSLVEIHPDHAATSRAALMALQSDPRLADRLPIAEVAFYEVSQPFAPNRLLDISGLTDRKRRAIECHTSQLRQLPYADFAQGLNRYRSMTLGSSAQAAEAYWIAPVHHVTGTPIPDLARAMSPAANIAITREGEPVSVVIRTRNRPEWLQEAVASALHNTHPVEVVVVNDGGAPPELSADTRLSVVNIDQGVGRSEAMNRGVAQAKRSLLCFLDDDDLYAEDHVEILASAMREGTRTAFYSDAVSVTLTRSEEGGWRERSRERRYAINYDPDLLVLDNYIPLPSLIVRREDYLSVGGFDREFDLFEDWDFILRLSARGPFERIPRLTCTIRHFEGSSSIVQAAARDEGAIADAKEKIWSRHGERLTHRRLAGLVERMKLQTRRATDQSTEATGRLQHTLRDVGRLEHDKTTLLIQLEQLGRRNEILEEQLRELRPERERRIRLEHELTGERKINQELSIELAETAAEGHRRWEEIQRLNQLLGTIYESKAWRLHTMVERLRRR